MGERGVLGVVLVRVSRGGVLVCTGQGVNAGCCKREIIGIKVDWLQIYLMGWHR